MNWFQKVRDFFAKPSWYVAADGAVYTVPLGKETEYEYAVADGPFRTRQAAEAFVCGKEFFPCLNCMEMIREDEAFCPFCGYSRRDAFLYTYIKDES